MEVRLASSLADLVAALQVRHEVFVDEQGVPPDLELDEHDDRPETDHFVVERDGRVVAAGRLVLEPAGFEGADSADGPVAHLGRLAVTSRARGLGLGVALVTAIEKRARERALRALYLSSQTHAIPFYERLGYTAYGEEFDDAGIGHRHMRKTLA